LGIILAAAGIMSAASLLSSSGNAKAATYDCNGNAVINCGAPTLATLKSDYNSNVQSIQKVYASAPFNISSSEMAAFFGSYPSSLNGATNGEIYSNGNVYVAGQLVATGASTAGRNPLACDPSSKANSAGVYVRNSSCSFLTSPLPAYVDMQNGVFQFAILSSCGNPVVATPVPPVYTCDALTLTTDTNNSVAPEINVATSYTAKNGASFISYTYKWGDGTSTITTQNPTTHIFNGSGPYTVTSSVTFKLNGVAAYPTKTGAGCSKTVSFPAAVYACSALNVTTVNNDNRTIKAQVAYKGSNYTKFKSANYNFGDGKTAVSTNATDTSVTHQYSMYDTYYPVSASVTFVVYGKDVTTAANNNCFKYVNFVAPPAPTYACSALNVTTVNNDSRTIKAIVSYKNSTAAVFKSANYNFGDGKTAVSTNAGNTSVTHQYAMYDTYYPVSATVTFVIQGKDVTTAANNNCFKYVNFVAPTYVCSGLTLTPVKNETREVQAVTTYHSANGATYKSVSYSFGDGSKALSSTNPKVNHSYSKYGTYTVITTVSFEVNGKTVTAPATAACKKSITFSAPSTPEYACTNLQLIVPDPSNPQSIQAVASFTETSGVTFKSASFDWGDGVTTAVIAATNNTVSADHSYDSYSTYNITASITFSVKGKTVTITQPVSAPKCMQAIIFTAPTTPTTPVTPSSPSTPSTIPTTTPEIPTTIPETPTASTTELVNTGPGDVIGMFGLTTVIGTAGHYILRVRKFGRL
jgi:hypothetical protein